MDSAVVALVAAGIPATVAAGTFAATQMIVLVSSRTTRRTEALLSVLDALERVPRHLVKPWILRVYSAPDIEIAMRATRLVAVLPRADRHFWVYLAAKAEELSRARGTARVEIAAVMSAQILLYLKSPKMVRRQYPRLKLESARTYPDLYSSEP